jgi:hypothetical protein
MVATPIHAITMSGKIFQWEKNQQEYFDELKQQIIHAPILTFPNLYKPFEVQTNASGYSTGAILMQGGKKIF